MRKISDIENFWCDKIVYVFEKNNAMPKGIVVVPVKDYGFVLLGLHEHDNKVEITDTSDLIIESKELWDKLWDYKYLDLLLKIMDETDKEDQEIEEIEAAMTEVQKKDIENLKDLLWRAIFVEPEITPCKLGEYIEKSCATCKNNVEYPPAHTCDVCTSLDEEEEYSMWEPKEV